ncbi:hypothetical protein Metvu_0573 [Methanocaldococcus vulcanius M7]|uniref:Uncharacterized protein n=1 Tax=Methanocaldococcus vulcanius (strain ATCC 700851 / DSM 12094 / M7) TaxID=579137 RepID=C9RFT0_METVM|nr:hypothetical protein [Methanocaldococcus vulcanius]ACX72432.1 hypothetical protein Metvu_0573 [Methanocaldococcus vulcanius M7]
MVTVEEYLKKAYPEVKLPSGFVFKVKTLSAYDILEVMGDIPIMQDLLKNPTSKDNIKENISKNPEFIKNFVEILPKLVEKCIVEPKGIKWEQLDGRDKDFLMNYVLSQLNVNENVASFREGE